jgi:hypothetical protein
MGWQECVSRFSAPVRSLRTLPFLQSRQAKDENLQFAKFSHYEPDKELNVLQNGSASSGTSVKRENSGWSIEGDDWDNFRYEHVDEVTDHGHGGNPNERISEWQAGWNVTNAIQVGLRYFSH